MANVTLYSFTRVADKDYITTVYRDSEFPTLITYSDVVGFAPLAQPADATPLSQICKGTTQYKYKSSLVAPYATVDISYNAVACGYVAPTCDLTEKTFDITDESATGAADGIVNFFATSSANTITYNISGVAINITNDTGYFTNLPPNTYTLTATDSNGCDIVKTAVVHAFISDFTHFKYRLSFSNVHNTINWELRLLDMRNSYIDTAYPVDIEGTDKAIMSKQGDQNADKTTTIISRSLEINLLFDNKTFTVEEFASAPEKQWKVELYRNGILDFQGWVLPDETQDYYADPSYTITLKATDGLPSLKGYSWGDGSGDNGYSTSQIQQYGLKQWGNLVKQCLDQLGYDYGDTTIFSSLTFDSTYRQNLWRTLGTWSDGLYDSDGQAVDTYSALQYLLGGLKLTIMQRNGKFILLNWNDLYYINNGIKSNEYDNSFYKIPSNWATSTRDLANKPILQQIGDDRPIVPINPMQSLTYDKAYNIKSKISFDVLALLYPNPSFEIGPVEGELPSGFYHDHGGVPGSGLTNDDSYDGLWSFKVVSKLPSPNTFIETEPPFYTIDQPGKVLNVSFMWKVPDPGDTGDFDLGYVFAFLPVFLDANTGIGYYLKTTDYKALSVQEATPGITFLTDIPENIWETLGDIGYTEGDACSIKGTPTKDFTGWQSYSITSPRFPGTGVGHLTIRWYSVKYAAFDPTTFPAPINKSERQHVYAETGPGETGYYLIDDFNITIADYDSNGYNLQTGELHQVNSVANVPQANTKNVDLDIFSYPINKRVAGNVLYGFDYDTAVSLNLWSFGLKTNDTPTRLSAAIVKAIARNYQRQMYIFEGDVQADYIDFYSAFILKGYEQAIFMPLYISLDLKLCQGAVSIVEIDDSEQQAIYKYTAVYQNNARRNITQ